MNKCLTLLIFLGFLTALSFAQSGRGTITGTITDASGAEVAGAEVAIISQTSGVETRAVSTTSGVYRAPYLAPDSYRLVATMKGFKTEVKDNIQLLLGQTITADFRLEIGELAESITVSSEPPLLEFGSMEIGINATEKEVHNWPIIIDDGTRQLQSFIFRTIQERKETALQGRSTAVKVSATKFKLTESPWEGWTSPEGATWNSRPRWMRSLNSDCRLGRYRLSMEAHRQQ